MTKCNREKDSNEIFKCINTFLAASISFLIVYCVVFLRILGIKLISRLIQWRIFQFYWKILVPPIYRLNWKRQNETRGWNSDDSFIGWSKKGKASQVEAKLLDYCCQNLT